jgi:UDP-N-acetylglucosamine--N-acetylmuramyl-(pentapeptide) pyrophosphoryl-undecaprenol N-acetylglucosamine transferase
VPGLRIIFAGGGTGGHVFPAIAIADEVRRLEPAAEVLFIGTAQKIEARAVPNAGYAFRPIWVSGFRRRPDLSTLLFPVKVIVAFMQSLSIIRSFSPGVVVGTGGYVSGPVVSAASLLGIPTAIHEQNSVPGATTRMLGRKVDEIYLTFESSRPAFQHRGGITVTGNPTRGSLEQVSAREATTYFGFDAGDPSKTILVFGGSLGAKTINDALLACIWSLTGQGIRVIWQTGTEEYARLKSQVAEIPPQRLWIHPFIDRMDLAYGASDLVVCRSGATTIAELTRLGKPAILVPYPHATANHQVENACVLEKEGAARIVYDNDAKGLLRQTIEELISSDDMLRVMSGKAKHLGMPDAAAVIARRVIALASGKGN